MSDLTAEFDGLMQRVRAGCPEAARELFEKYGHHVYRVVRRRLDQRLRRQYDSIDFSQSVWASFFQVPAERFTFHTPEELIGFLSRLASHKVIDAVRRRLGTDRYDAEREQPLPPRTDEEDWTDKPVRHPPTPSQVAIANERWERLMEGQPPEIQQALEMLRTGHTHQEVAASLGVTPKMIQRMLRRIRLRRDLR